MQRRRRTSIGSRLSLLVAGLAGGVMLLIVATVASHEQGEQLDYIAHVQDRIGEYIAPLLAEELRNGHHDDVRHLVLGLKDFNFLAFAELVAAGDTISAGVRLPADQVIRTLAVTLPVGDPAAQLRVQFDRSRVRAAVFEHTRTETTYSLLLVLIAATATVVLFRTMVTRHLDGLAEYARSLTLDTLEREHRLKRKRRGAPDELDRIHEAIDTMRRNLLHEVAARREAERRLHGMQRMEVVGRLAAGVAHDFNNLLAGIMGTAETIVREARTPDVRGYGEMIVGTSRRAADLTGRLLSFSRQAPVAVVPRDLHGIVDDVCAILSRSIDKKITLAKELCAGQPRVAADHSQLESALFNLCLNARDAMPDGGVLTIGTALVRAAGAGGDMVEISVADTGQGIPDDVRDAVFEPFFTTKKQGTGTGLGLASAAATVRDHGGTIGFDSKVGHGTVFRIRLPLVAAEVPERQRDSDTVVLGAGLVLVIDDESTVRSLLERNLLELGYGVLSAEDGAAGLEVYRRHAGEIDVVLLDMIMPNMDGARTFAAIRELDPDARVVITTGYADDASLDALIAAGALGVLRKPFLFADLSRVVAEATAR
jgi:signal transduction histidine kinase/CheY-like chemotaxis protein